MSKERFSKKYATLDEWLNDMASKPRMVFTVDLVQRASVAAAFANGQTIQFRFHIEYDFEDWVFPDPDEPAPHSGPVLFANWLDWRIKP